MDISLYLLGLDTYAYVDVRFIMGELVPTCWIFCLFDQQIPFGRDFCFVLMNVFFFPACLINLLLRLKKRRRIELESFC